MKLSNEGQGTPNFIALIEMKSMVVTSSVFQVAVGKFRIKLLGCQSSNLTQNLH